MKFFLALKGLLLLILVFVFFSTTPSLSEKKYGPEYFYAIDGEVAGQAAPGVQEVYVNGISVPIDSNFNFKKSVHLKEGQKYLSIETTYKDLRFVKKYLIVRYPEAKKPFKVHIPEKEFKKIIKTKKRRPARKTKIAKRKKSIKRTQKTYPPKEKWLGFDFVAELEPGKLIIIREVDGKYFAAISIPESNAWIPLHKISAEELKELLNGGTTPSSLDP